MRLIRTRNASPEHFEHNIIACDETGWDPQKLTEATLQKVKCGDSDFIVNKAKAVLTKYQIVPAKDQVLCTNLLAFVSPKYLRDGSETGPVNADKVDKMLKGTLKLFRKKYGDRLLCSMLHRDEANPHISLYVVPLVEKSIASRGRKKKSESETVKPRKKKWCLSCYDSFTPDRTLYYDDENGKRRRGRIPGTCSLLQEEYASALRDEGLDVQRGVVKEQNQPSLEYETTNTRYKRLSEPVADIQSLNDQELREWAIKNAPLAAESQRAREERNYYQCEAAAAQNQLRDLQKQVADSQRTIAVEAVVTALMGIDARPPSSEQPVEVGTESYSVKSEFLLPSGQKIGITDGNGFVNLTPDIPFLGQGEKRRKGKGAIDVVSFLTGWTFQEATEWIADEFSDDIAKTATVQALDLANRDLLREARKGYSNSIAKELENSVETTWPQVREQMVKTFRINAKEIDILHRNQWIHSNKYSHAVFKKGCWNDAEELERTGVIVVDLNHPETPIKETGEGLGFIESPKPKKAIVCASPLEGLVIKSNPDFFSHSVFVIGQQRDKGTLKTVEKIFKGFKKAMLLADASNEIGRNLAGWVKEHFPGIDSLPIPKGFTSWLEWRQKADSAQPPPRSQMDLPLPSGI